MNSSPDRAGIAASAGSACAAGTRRPSRVLVAMGHRELSRSAIRFSLSRLNGDGDIERLLAVLPAILREAHATLAEVPA